MLKLGDVVFFKKCTRSAQRRSPEIGFKGGHGFGVMIGLVPPGAPDPRSASVSIFMGQAGFVSFDDVGAILGQEQLNTLIKKFEEKHYPKEAIQAKAKLILQGSNELPKAD